MLQIWFIGYTKQVVVLQILIKKYITFLVCSLNTFYSLLIYMIFFVNLFLYHF